MTGNSAPFNSPGSSRAQTRALETSRGVTNIRHFGDTLATAASAALIRSSSIDELQAGATNNRGPLPRRLASAAAAALLIETSIEPSSCGRVRASCMESHGAVNLPELRSGLRRDEPCLQGGRVGPWGGARMDGMRHFQPAGRRPTGSERP